MAAGTHVANEEEYIGRMSAEIIEEQARRFIAPNMRSPVKISSEC
jgi:hypothetical protein